MSAQPEPLAGVNTLSPGNKALVDALCTAISVIYHLDDAGSTATDIDIRGGRAVLQIDRRPAFVQGVAAVTRSTARMIVRRMVAPFHGAQIEWTQRDEREVRP